MILISLSVKLETTHSRGLRGTLRGTCSAAPHGNMGRVLNHMVRRVNEDTGTLFVVFAGYP